MAPLLDPSRSMTNRARQRVHRSAGILAQSDTETSCAFKHVCYNAETTSNKLSRKGLSLLPNWSLRTARLTCALAATLAMALPATSVEAAQTQKSSTAKKTSATTTAKPAAKTSATTTRKPVVAKTRSTAYSASAARARRAKLARARSIAQAKAMAEVAQPKFKTDSNGDEVPDPRAEAAII